MTALSLVQIQKKTLISLAAFLIAFISVTEQYTQALPHFTNYRTTVYKTQEVHTQSVKVISQESLTENIVKQDSPSVVTIIGTIPVAQNLNSISFSQSEVIKNVHTVGSGFIISTKGIILTNKHTLSDPSETYQVITADDKKYSIKDMYLDPRYDIAVVKINPQENTNAELKEIALGDSTSLQVGQSVVAIGTSLGELRNTVTTGIVSGLNRSIQADNPDSGSSENLSNLIQTSAAINPGNSGGPLINNQQQVVGITVATSAQGQNIGFALPINLVKNTLAHYYARKTSNIF